LTIVNILVNSFNCKDVQELKEENKERVGELNQRVVDLLE